ncbi:AI-2E family transporter [Candidatus Gracilibacteria bacterium]|nr:AI-2E family transporter [Candidatus Gracilibacteria bacterium]
MKDINKLLLPLWLIAIFLIFVVLYIGKSLIITIVFTSILLFIFSGMYSFFYKKIKSHVASVIITGGIFLIFFTVVGFIITSEIDNFSNDIGKIGEGFGSFSEQLSFVPSFISSIDYASMLEKIDFSGIGKTALTTISGIVGGLSTVAFLLIFLMLEKNMFAKKMRKILPDSKEKKFFKTYEKIYNDMNTFFLSKFSLALLNGTVSVIIMQIFGLEYALMFGLLVFLLDFIPAIGGIIALALPFLYSFVQFDSGIMSFILLFCLFIPQFISGNMIEPKVMGDRLNLSSFIILIALIFWSSIWGITGAFLAVPLMASMNIVLAQFQTTKPLAILFSKNGNV